MWLALVKSAERSATGAEKRLTFLTLGGEVALRRHSEADVRGQSLLLSGDRDNGRLDEFKAAGDLLAVLEASPSKHKQIGFAGRCCCAFRSSGVEQPSVHYRRKQDRISPRAWSLL